jgi:GDP-L-fucose synthase
MVQFPDRALINGGMKVDKSQKIYVAGHRGMVGSAIVRQLQSLGYNNIVTRTREELDLQQYNNVLEFFKAENPDYVFMAAAKVGGIMANHTQPASFLYENLAIQMNVIHAAYLTGVERLMFLGSSCIYPKFADQPIKEEYLLTGALEPTNEPYAIAKIAGIKQCQTYNRQYGTRYISVMPTNLYGTFDNFDLATSHVMPALIRKFHEAKINNVDRVTVWGSGTPRREFLHVDDLAAACVYLMEHPEKTTDDLYNIGTGSDLTIAELAQLIKQIVGFEGAIEYDSSKPDGTPRKLLDVYRIASLGWSPAISLEDGIKQTYDWFVYSGDKV